MKVVIDIPEIPTNDKQRWALANGTPYEERPHGEWKACLDTEYCKCSYCGTVVMLEESVRFDFCPNCGADMRKEGEKE